ncbi:MAG TPA: class I SAM-dependent methyltransferase [Candidatus Woesearchaeota archaeon]|nr:class I SAM-dependent methyltransferase [Candidatus Woesearchaeota archaeon]
MGKILNIITPVHTSTKRDYIGRMIDEKIKAMKVARKFDFEFWDGDRKFGYGGYYYDGRQEKIAQKLIETYGLKEDARILDVGCGKGFLLYEFKKLLPKCLVKGFDISEYAISHAKEEIKESLFVHDAKNDLPFKSNEFDLVVSINTLHNLKIYDLKNSLKEVERVGNKKYIVVESFRNEEEQFNLQCWALTGSCVFTPEEWEFIFSEFGYTGDYEFIFFE